MKLARSVVLVLCFAGSIRAADPPRETYCNPLDVAIADPFVLKHDGTYYLYGTFNARRGFEAWTSKDLVNWQAKGFVYEPAEGDWSRNMFWAPEIFQHRGKFYLHGSAYQETNRHRLILMESNTPLGPFKTIAAPWGDIGKTVIDGHVFRDDDGKLYLYYVLDARENQHSDVYVREVGDDLMTFGKPIYCIKPEQAWEGTVINEGPFVMKRGKTYFLMYSGNGATDTWYGVGYATSDSPLGPWKKFYGNPILRRTNEVSGPGHHSVIESPDGKELFVVYHTHQQPSNPSWSRQLAIDRLEIFDSTDGPRMRVVGPTIDPQPMPSGAPAQALARDDEFDGSSIDHDRWTIFNQRPDEMRLADGWLTITADDNEIREQRASLHNILLQRLPAGDFQVTTRVKFEAQQPLERAFLCLWQDHNNFIRLSTTFQDTPILAIGREKDGRYESKEFPNDLGRDVQLRIEKRGKSVTYQASGDGKSWKTLAEDDSLPLVDLRVGIGAAVPDRADVPASFDFLHVRPPPHQP